MFQNEMRKLERRIEKLEQKRTQARQEDDGMEILLDFNRKEPPDQNRIYLLCKVPPRSQWKIK